ncbi:topoisomerase DNA-binding C4 zinc finger domain-containing protein [Pantoea sp. B9002]|uniref:DNA topoisomerase n=1 Tax=Pantoea sp. B9002 TaxID=2726979 RepID=UPI0015A4793A|nr:DNA topoisomerase [Pantoea sp. B9002]NWA64071.1 topoisomerase DNA-binding C4 zinc finger domain-containing protein [Pantoea sp. B9002]
MKLFIAEKPSLARAIVDGIGGNAEKKNGYYKIGDKFITWSRGHILRNKMPDEINPEFKKWKFENLPYKFTPLELVPVEETRPQLEIIGRLLQQAKVIINAGDPDEEGQLLIDEILDYYGVNPDADNVYRVLIADVNEKAVQKSLSKLKPNKEFAGLRHTALARSGADLIYGINMTQAYTLKAQESGYTGLLSVGRVQTAIHGLIVSRARARRDFVASDFYRIIADVKAKGKTFSAELSVPDSAPTDDKGRIVNKDYADALISRLKGTQFSIVEKEQSPQVSKSPLLMSLLSLQIHMGKLSGMSSKDVDKCAQTLYETHKAASYPRTDNSYISTEQWEAAGETLETIAKIAPDLLPLIKNADTNKKSRAVNDKKISAHTAIIPVPTNPKELSKAEMAVYIELSKIYIAQFYPDKIKEKISLMISNGDFYFESKSSKVTERGWSEIFSDDDDSEDENSYFDILNIFEADDVLTSIEFRIEKGKTTAPELYTEPTLLADLPQVKKYVEDERLREAFAKRDKERGEDNAGIGTPATRSGIFDTLKQRGYFTIERKKIIPTKAGEDFYDALPRIAVVPDMTALWSIEQGLIREGQITVDAFLAKVETFVSQQIDNLKNITIELASYSCPECGKKLRLLKGKNGDFWSCSGFRDEPQCTVTFPDHKGSPDTEGVVKAKADAKKARELKATTCPKCSRQLKRIKDKKEEGKYYWACSGLFDTTNPCKSFFPEEKGKPLLKGKDKS